jgi:hypothetical protein
MPPFRQVALAQCYNYCFPPSPQAVAGKPPF